jgi:hypothetical protein
MALILGDIRPRTSNKLIHPYNDILYQKEFGSINAYNNCYIEIIVKLGQKNNGTYGCIVISKDIVILSIVMRRFCCRTSYRAYIAKITAYYRLPKRH